VDASGEKYRRLPAHRRERIRDLTVGGEKQFGGRCVSGFGRRLKMDLRRSTEGGPYAVLSEASHGHDTTRRWQLMSGQHRAACATSGDPASLSDDASERLSFAMFHLTVTQLSL